VNRQKGFTLIELMIVVAIIAILAAIAISQYQDYVAKAQFSEAATITDGMKTKLAEFYSQAGVCPVMGTSPGFAMATSYSGKYVAQITVNTVANGCALQATFKSQSVAAPLVGQSVTFTGENQGGTFTWTCASAIDGKYKPQACQQ
jgi:type IV pilus assembly protein PilA